MQRLQHNTWSSRCWRRTTTALPKHCKPLQAIARTQGGNTVSIFTELKGQERQAICTSSSGGDFGSERTVLHCNVGYRLILVQYGWSLFIPVQLLKLVRIKSTADLFLNDCEYHTVCDWQMSCCRRVKSFLSSLDFLPSFSSCVIFWAGVVRRWRWSDLRMCCLVERSFTVGLLVHFPKPTFAQRGELGQAGMLSPKHIGKETCLFLFSLVFFGFRFLVFFLLKGQSSPCAEGGRGSKEEPKMISKQLNHAKSVIRRPGTPQGQKS